MERNSRIYVAGHTGMVGSAIVRILRNQGFSDPLVRTSEELDLRRQEDVEVFFRAERPEYVFLAAAKVGGILANDSLRAEFLYDNLLISSNIIHASHLSGAEKLLFLGSSCVYPRNSPQPIGEACLLEGALEPTNEPYAIAKIAGIKMCGAYRRQYGCNFISAMPTNLYGSNDNYHLEKAHVLPALIRRFHEAKKADSESVTVWGTGSPRREFLHVDDLAEACIFLMQHYNEAEHINVGTGIDLTIAELAQRIKTMVGFEGNLNFDKTRPDGTPQKLLDVSKLTSLGWKYRIELDDGLKLTYQDFLATFGNWQL